MAPLQVQPPAQPQLLELRGTVDDGLVVGAGSDWGEGEGEGGVPEDELEGAAEGGVDGAEEVGAGVAEAGAEVRGEAEVGGEVDELGQEEAAVGREHEEPLELGG